MNTNIWRDFQICVSVPLNVIMKLRKIKSYSQGVLISHLKNRFFQNQYQKQVKTFVFIPELVSREVFIHIQYFFDPVRNKLQTLNIY